MSDKFNVLKEEINEGFYEVVGIINEIICHRTETFSEMLELSEDIHEGSEEFIKDTGKIIDTISSEINKKIEKLNIDKMKEDIEEATETFIAITEELELLSYNTICRTMALGEKGASITHISKEIKKYSTTVKDLLENITKNFNGMFVKFKNISDSLMDNQLIPEQVSIGAEDTEELVISSDVSVLIENSQFHDIYMQELEIINDAVSKTEFSDAYEAGRIFGVYEKAISKLDRIKHDLQDKLESIKDVMRDFMYSFNTDLQNMVSKTNILSLELSKISEVSQRGESEYRNHERERSRNKRCALRNTFEYRFPCKTVENIQKPCGDNGCRGGKDKRRITQKCCGVDERDRRRAYQAY